MRYSILIVLYMLLVGPSQALSFFSSTPEDLQSACAALAEGLGPGPGPGKTVAVRAFSSPDRQKTLLGIRIQDLLTNGLTGLEGRRFRVVERLRIAELDMERMSHGRTRGDDLDSWARGLRADLVVVGTWALEGGFLVLDCRVVDPDTGRSLGTAHARVKLTKEIRRLASTPAPATATAAAMEAIAPAGSSWGPGRRSRLRLFTMARGRPSCRDQGRALTLKVGERMGFSVRPPMDSNLYIFNYDPRAGDDEVVFVYPLPMLRPKTFFKGRTYTFPRCIDPRAISYPVEPPLGRMVFKVIGVEAGQGHGDLVEGLDGSKGYYTLRQNDLKRLISRLAVLPEASWWEESAEFWISRD